MTRNAIIKELLSMAWSERGVGNYSEVVRLLEEAKGLCSNSNFLFLGRIFHIYMQIASDKDDYTEALAQCQKSVACYIRSGNQDRIAHATRHLADIEFQLNEMEAAESNYRTSIDMYRSNDQTTKGDLANALRAFGLLLVKLDKKEEAIHVWTEVKSLYKACNLQMGVDEASQFLKKLI